MAGQLQQNSADGKRRRLVVSRPSLEGLPGAKDGEDVLAVNNEAGALKTRKRLRLVKTTGPPQASVPAAAHPAPVVKREPAPTLGIPPAEAAAGRLEPVNREPAPAVDSKTTEAAAAHREPGVKREPAPDVQKMEAASGHHIPVVKREPTPRLDILFTGERTDKLESATSTFSHQASVERADGRGTLKFDPTVKTEPSMEQNRRRAWRTGRLRVTGTSDNEPSQVQPDSLAAGRADDDDEDLMLLSDEQEPPQPHREVKLEAAADGSRRETPVQVKLETSMESSRGRKQVNQEQPAPGQAIPAAALPMTTDGRCAPDLRDSADMEEERKTDFSALLMHDDFSSRPVYACPDGRIIFETWHSKSAQVADFLIAVAEPVSRPELIHEYQITMLSLNAAVSTGIEVETIIKLLRKVSKNELAPEFVRFIKDQGRVIGRLKLVLRNQRHFLEADDIGLLAKLLTNSEIEGSLVDKSFVADTIQRATATQRLHLPCPSPDSACSNEQDPQDEQATGLTSASAEIHSLRVETVKSAGHQMNMPLLQEYEYKQDTTDANPELPILLRNSASLRPYQQRALSKMFAVDGVAKSGIVVLPCGAGKTLTGIAACSRIQRRTLVLTTTAVAVDQWKRQLIEYTTIPPEDIYVFTAEHKRPIEDHERRACVLISTYSMLGFGGKRTGDSELVLSQIEQLDWGLMIVDEVQVMPARTFRTVATTVKAHCCLGLTATLVREDDLIYDLHWLIGPKLYEANWQQLQDEGFLARVRCVEVWCEMSKPFFAEYLHAVDDKDGHKRRALWNCNPNKLKVCEYLIKVHESRGDKTIVFSDNIFILEKLAKQLGRYYICGKVDMRERMQILAAFKESPNCNTIFLSQVGDNAIDIPAASVIVQISSHYGSRRQEAQRLGRILRPKPKSHGSTSKFNAFFYSLVSRDTQEMYYANRRQQFLVEQGYNYYILRNLADKRMDNDAPTYTSEDAQLQLLKEVLETLRRGDMGEAEEEDVALNDSNVATVHKVTSADKSEAPTAGVSNRQTVSEKTISLASLSGGLDGSYAVTAAFRQKSLKPDGAL